MSKVKKMVMGFLPFYLFTFLPFIASCSDEWDDHYKPEAQNQISGQSLWETIESNSELSNFASVIKAAGYDKSLGGSQAFTVFAPVNSDFSAEEAQSLINTYNTEKAAGTKDKENTTIKEFLQNHIALYNTSVSSETNDSLVMMNGKYQVLTNTTFAGHQLLSSNQACANGILYTIDGQASYYPNVFEYLGKDNDIDSVANFLYSFNKYEFNAAQSVPGDIVNGQTVYLDSVTTLTNDETHNNLGQIDSEDSTYWLVVPTNDEWNRLVPQYEKYFQYDNTVTKRDSMTWANARFGVLAGTSFSRTKNTDAAIQDSAMSTSAVSYNMRYYMYGSYNLKYYQYDHPLAEGGIFNGTTNVQCSNGQVMKKSNWNIDPTQTFMQTQIVQGESSSRLDSVDQATTGYPLTTYNVLTSSPYYDLIGGHSYAQITPTGTSSNTTAYFSLPNLLSNVGYDIYVVTAPALAGDTLATATQRLPTTFRVYLRSQRQDGTLSESTSNWTLLDGKNNTTSRSRAIWTTTQDQVDTFKVANNVQIPYTTYGTGNSPKVELIFQTTPTNRNVREGVYNRILRIDQIIVVPHQEDED